MCVCVYIYIYIYICIQEQCRHYFKFRIAVSGHVSLSQIEILVLEGVSLTLMPDIYLIQSQEGRLYALRRGVAEEILVLNQTWLPAQRKSQRGCEEFHSSLPPWFSPSLLAAPNLALLHVLRYLSLALLPFFPPFCNLFPIRADLYLYTFTFVHSSNWSY